MLLCLHSILLQSQRHLKIHMCHFPLNFYMQSLVIIFITPQVIIF